MSENVNLMKHNEVISLNDWNDRIALSHITFKVNEFLYKLVRETDRDVEKQKQWIEKGVECEILSPNAGWKKGKIRVALEFIPEEAESILDDIRQTIS